MIPDGLGPARRWLAVSAVGVLGKAPNPTEAGGRWRGYQPGNRKQQTKHSGKDGTLLQLARELMKTHGRVWIYAGKLDSQVPILAALDVLARLSRARFEPLT